jgi:hypothetical protein
MISAHTEAPTTRVKYLATLAAETHAAAPRSGVVQMVANFTYAMFGLIIARAVDAALR